MKTHSILALAIIAFMASAAAQAKYSGGSCTSGDPYKIGSAADLLVLAADTGDYNKYFILTADVNLASYTFTTAVIARDTNNANEDFDGVAFTGTFDGAGHKITHLAIDTNTGTFGVGNDYLGLFGYLDSGEIKNLGLENVTITGGNDSSDLGGLVGRNDGGTISNCYSMGAVSGDNAVGGLVGRNHYEGNISNCYSTVTVSGGYVSWFLGGLVGRNDGRTISNCFSTGAVTGEFASKYLGGLVGYNDGPISNCYSTGNVNGDNSKFLGGLVGQNFGNISTCYSIGDVTDGDGSESESLGGLVGDNGGTISNCYSMCNVTGGSGSYYLGGLVGYNSGGTAISNCYTVASIRGYTDVGPLVGYNYGSSSSIKRCYYLAGSGTTNGYGTPLVGEKMKQQSSFVSWDFVGETTNGTADIWTINEGTDYPRLALESSPSDTTFEYDLSADLDVWDITGTYDDDSIGCGINYTITQDAAGKITGYGDASCSVDGYDIDMSFTIKGTVTQKNNIATVKLTFKFSGWMSDGVDEWKFKASAAATAIINTILNTIEGTVKVCVSGEGCETVDFELTLPDDMDGSAELSIDVEETNAKGTKLGGTGTLTLSNDDEYNFNIKGSYNAKKGLDSLTLTGTGGKFTLVINDDGGNLNSLKGKSLGQSLAASNIPAEAD